MSISIKEITNWIGPLPDVHGDVPSSFTDLVIELGNAHGDGWLFWPATNPIWDERNNIAKAKDAGAAAVVVDREWAARNGSLDLPMIVVNEVPYELLKRTVAAKRDSFGGAVIAVSGSAGKTTTRELIAAFLRGAGQVHSTNENSNSGGGQCTTLLQAPAIAKYIVSEVGICGPQQMKHSCRLLKPTVATLASIGTAHVGNFKGDRLLLAKEKAKIFDKLWGAYPFGVVSREIDYLDLIRQKSNVPLVEVSLEDRTAPYFGEIADVVQGRMRIVESKTGLATELVLGRPGRFMCANALLGFAIARELGVTPAQCLDGLKTFSVPGSRWRKVCIDGVNYIDDTFNANAASMKAVLDAAKSMSGRVIVVYGDMLELGDLSEELHREVGRYAAHAFLDEFITFGPMSCRWMADEYDQGLPHHKALRTQTLDGVQQMLKEVACPGDTVILKASNAMNLANVLNKRAVA